jgi:hypothetical protein
MVQIYHSWEHTPKNQSAKYRDTCIPMFIMAPFTTAKLQNQPGYPSAHEQINKMRCVHTMEFYSAIKKNEIMLEITR